jgi:hypothetical protein
MSPCLEHSAYRFDVDLFSHSRLQRKLCLDQAHHLSRSGSRLIPLVASISQRQYLASPTKSILYSRCQYEQRARKMTRRFSISYQQISTFSPIWTFSLQHINNLVKPYKQPARIWIFYHSFTAHHAFLITFRQSNFGYCICGYSTNDSQFPAHSNPASWPNLPYVFLSGSVSFHLGLPFLIGTSFNPTPQLCALFPLPSFVT